MAMDLGGAKGGVKSDINVTPLVDVMLVLLIIMMLVAPMLQQGVSVKLPTAENTVDKPEQQYPWVRDAVSRPYIKSTGDSLRIILQRLVPSSLMGPEQQQGLLLQQDNNLVARAGGKRVRVVLYRGGPARTNT